MQTHVDSRTTHGLPHGQPPATLGGSLVPPLRTRRNQRCANQIRVTVHPLRLFIVTLITLCAASILQAGSGILELDSKPGGAEIFVDGKKKGTTPETEGQKLTMELPEGDHEVKIKKEGVGSAKKKVFVREGVIQPLTMTMQVAAFMNH